MTEHAKAAARLHLQACEELVQARREYEHEMVEANAIAARVGVAWEKMTQARATVDQRAMELQESLRLE